MKILLNFLILCLLLTGCSSFKTKKEEEMYTIFSLLIEKYGKASLPPPPPGETYSFTKSQFDSIYNQAQKIAIYPMIRSEKKKFTNNSNFGAEYNSLIMQLNNSEKEMLFNLDKVSIKKTFQLSILDTLEQKKNRRYLETNFDKILSFSNISFNDTYDKAVLVVASSKGYLNSMASLVYLEKTNGLWEVKNVDTFQIS